MPALPQVVYDVCAERFTQASGLLSGKFSPQDSQRAAELLIANINTNIHDAESLCNLATIFAEGWVLVEDSLGLGPEVPGQLEVAAALYLQAYALGHLNALHNFSVIGTHGGEDFPSDLPVAVKTFEIASNRGG